VDPRTIDPAARRAAALIVQLGGGSLDAKPAPVGARLLHGVLQDGAEPEPLTRVSMRTARARAILGADIQTGDMIKALRGHEVQLSIVGGSDDPSGPTEDDTRRLDCTIPPFRPDLTREIDLIEEVARTLGLSRIPILEKIDVRVAPPQVTERARAEMASVLTGLGFFETVTFSFVAPAAAEPFMPAGMMPLMLCDERRKADPVLRPSVLPSLLACRKSNQDGGVAAPGGVRLYEVASVFAQPDRGRAGALTGERRVLAMIADAVAPDGSSSAKPIDIKQGAVRLIRGALDSLARTLGGPRSVVQFVPVAPPAPAPQGFDASAVAEVRLNGNRIGAAGMIDPAIERAYDLHAHSAAAEVDVDALLALYPPKVMVEALPAFPGIERDLSFVVDEGTRWSEIDSLIGSSGLERLDGWEFVTTFRGPQLGPGKKSVTVRLRFRDPSRTLRHEEVDPQVAALVRLATDRISATLRA
jgi:phenylalanyl-tRNA synthetase beta chain